MNYKSKYLKYKIKYCNLKNNLITGGGKFNKDEDKPNNSNKSSSVKKTIKKIDFNTINSNSELSPYRNGRHISDPVVPQEVSFPEFFRDHSERDTVFKLNQEIQKKVNEPNQADSELLKGQSASLEKLFSSLRTSSPEPERKSKREAAQEAAQAAEIDLAERDKEKVVSIHDFPTLSIYRKE